MRSLESSSSSSLPSSSGRRGGIQTDSMAVKYLLSSSAAAVAETVTYPLDIIKTRLQIQGEMMKRDTVTPGSKNLPHGMFGTAYNIVKNEGALKLWTGVTPAVYRHLVYTGSRLVFYEQLREYFKRDGGEFPLWLATLLGVGSGALAQFIASPTDLVKVIMQAEGKRVLEGGAPRIKSVSQAFIQIYREGGIKGLWRGSVVNVQRAALVSLGDLATYDLVKHYFIRHFGMKDNYQVHIIGSLVSGLIAATMGTPADVIKTRIMCQPTDSFGRGTLYKSSWHCLVLTVGNEGFFGLYKGYWPTWLRMAPWSLTFWLTYEQIRKRFGLLGF